MNTNYEIYNFIATKYSDIVPKEIKVSHQNYADLFTISQYDSNNYLGLLLHRDHSSLTIPTEEINNIMEQMSESLKQRNEQQLNNIKNKVSKTYSTKEALQEDEKNIVIKDLFDNEDNKLNPFEYMHSQMKLKLGSEYTETLNDFTFKALSAIKTRDINDKKIEELYLRQEHSDVLKQVILDVSIRGGDKCFVEDEGMSYIYDSIKKEWVPEDMFDDMIDAKKLLKFSNKTNDDYDSTIKSSMIEKDVKLIMREHLFELNKNDEDRNTRLNEQISRHKDVLVQIYNNNLKQFLKYNTNKLLFDRLLTISQDDINKQSPYFGLLIEILGEEDLYQKFTYINRFIKKFTTHSDGKWFYCIETASKLVPVYLHKLATAYLVTNNYKDVLDEICFHEGEKSDDGSQWVHKESGFVLKDTIFDEDEGYDDNGMKTKTREVIIEDDEDDADDIDNLFDYLEVSESKDIDVEMHLNEHQKLIKRALQHYNRELGITMTKDKLNDAVKTIFNIFINSYNISKRNKTDDEKKVMKETFTVYSILCYIIVFFQTSVPPIKTTKTFRNCKSSFKGYPYSGNDDDIDAINYMACFIPIISEKMNRGGNVSLYKHFTKMERQDLMNKLLMYMNSFTLKEFKIQTMISQRKIYDSDLNNLAHSLRNQPADNTYNFNFSPSIVDIELNDEYTAISNSNRVLNPYIHNDNHRNMSGYMTKEFELLLNDYVNKQQHLLHYNSVPFLVNACCNEDNKQLKTLKYFSDNDENVKLQVNKLNTFHEKNQF